VDPPGDPRALVGRSVETARSDLSIYIFPINGKPSAFKSAAGCVLLLATFVGLAACGSDSKDATGSLSTAKPKPSQPNARELEEARLAEEGPPLPKTEFIKRANATCAQQRHEILEHLAEYRREHAADPGGRKLFARSVGDVILPGLLFWHDVVRILSAPRADNTRVEAKVTLWEKELIVGNDHPYSFHSGTELAALFAPFNSFARSYGLTDCVVTPTTFPGGS